MPFDFSEVFTHSARRVVPLVRSRSLYFSFDCEADGVTLLGDTRAHQGAFHRLACAVLELLQGGFMLMAATTDSQVQGTCSVIARFAGVGPIREDAIDEVVRSLGLEVEQAVPDSPTGKEYRAHGVCPWTQGQVALHVAPIEGVLITLTLGGATLENFDDLPSADGARAWLVNVDDVLANSWTRRLQRYGWAVSRFSSEQEAMAHLQSQPTAAKPALVLLLEKSETEQPPSDALAAVLPASTQLIHAVPAGSSTLSSSVDGWQVRVFPFSPADLVQFIELIEDAETPTGTTRPVPLAAQEMPLILIIDDKELNLVIGRGLTEALGYRVNTANSAREGFTQCMQEPPQVVLLDLHMPEMDGLAVAKEMRRLQKRGAIPPFPILGFTAAWSDTIRSRCIDAGMDDCMPKPIELSKLSQTLKRFSTVR